LLLSRTTDAGSSVATRSVDRTRTTTSSTRPVNIEGGPPDPPSTEIKLKLVGRFRTQEGRVVRVIAAATGAANGERGPVAPRGAVADDADRDPWWFLKALGYEAYQKHF